MSFFRNYTFERDVKCNKRRSYASNSKRQGAEYARQIAPQYESER
jgi:hypothetical protein